MFESRHDSFLKCTCHVKRSDHHAMATELYRGYRVLCLRCRRSQVRAMQVLSFPMMDQDPSLNVAARADARGLDWDFHSTAVPYMASSG